MSGVRKQNLESQISEYYLDLSVFEYFLRVIWNSQISQHWENSQIAKTIVANIRNIKRTRPADGRAFGVLFSSGE